MNTLAIERRSPRPNAWIMLGVFVVGMVATLASDQTLWRTAYVGSRDAVHTLEDRDWYRLMRVMGYWPTWVLIAAGLTIARPYATRSLDRFERHAGAWIVLSGGIAGLLAEGLKLVLSRERPSELGVHEGMWRGLFSGLTNSHNLGMPSSHAAVAFGACFMVGRIWPRLAPLTLLTAIACGISRMLAGAHFASDVFLGASVGYVVCWAVESAALAGEPIRPAEGAALR